MDPEEILSSDDILKKLETICNRNFSAENDQNECYVFVIDSLKADNFRATFGYEAPDWLTMVQAMRDDFEGRSSEL